MTSSRDTLGKRLIRAAKEGHAMTLDEVDAQRKSWVVVELMLAHPNMTREQAEGIYEKASGGLSGRLSFADWIGGEG